MRSCCPGSSNEPSSNADKFDLVYASAIFSHSAPRLDELRGVHPDAIIGGTGAGGDLSLTVEQTLGTSEYEHYDYSIYPDYRLEPGLHTAGLPAELRVLRGAQEGGPPQGR